VQRRSDAEEHPGNGAHRGHDQDHPAIQRHAFKPRDVRADREHRSEDPASEPDPQDAAGHGEQQALGQVEGEHALATRAEGSADRDFPAPPGGPREQQARRVHAGNEENDSNGS
jgi:hypothetical protein